MYLNGTQAEEGDSNVPVKVVCDPSRHAAELESSPPSGNPDDVSWALASNMEVEPSRICQLEHFQVSCNDGPSWQKNTPTHRVQYSMGLQVETQVRMNDAVYDDGCYVAIWKFSKLLK